MNDYQVLMGYGGGIEVRKISFSRPSDLSLNVIALLRSDKKLLSMSAEIQKSQIATPMITKCYWAVVVAKRLETLPFDYKSQSSNAIAMLSRKKKLLNMFA